jgi:hypothetical protein
MDGSWLTGTTPKHDAWFQEKVAPDCDVWLSSGILISNRRVNHQGRKSMMKPQVRSVSLQVLLALAAWSPALTAQATPAQSSPPTQLTAGIRTSVIEAAIGRLEQSYIEADTGKLIGEQLRRKLQSGAYDRFDNPAQFADAVTRDLRSLNGDLHLSLRYVTDRGPNRTNPLGDPRRQNFGLGRVEILPGNIGYLEITAFAGGEGYQEAVGDAMRLLARADAIIIDVRRNGGGSGEMSHLVFSHFLGADPVPTIAVKRRSSPEPTIRKSFAEVPGPRRTDVPLYVLTSQSTGSAAEEFSFVLKNHRRATIVGSRTAGAGHMVNGFPIGSGFVLGVSITRVSDPVTGKEWEKVGVQPDRAVPAEAALLEAHAAALRRLVEIGQDQNWNRSLSRILATVEARQTPRQPDQTWLARLAGDYAGRTVSVRNGRLFYARSAGGLGEELTWLGGNRFGLGPTQYLFEEEGNAVRLIVEPPDGTRVSFQRGEPGAG